jgi:signal transduction histidine kinase
MVIPENRLFCRLDGLNVQQRSQQRLAALISLGLLEPEGASIFEEAVQMAAQFTGAPIAMLSIVEPEKETIQSALGLNRLGQMNALSRERQLPRSDSFGVHVADSQQVLAIEDTQAHPAFAASLLAQQYGIRAYLGVPMFSADGLSVGVLAVLFQEPQTFSHAMVEYLVLTARLAMSDYERRRTDRAAASLVSPIELPAPTNHPIKFDLLAQLTQELRTPLTSVMGMASVLTREIYGPLTGKQKEYMDIIRHSGEYLLSLVQEILELSSLDPTSQQLNLSSVDIEMLCQQAIGTLEQAASRREQQIRLSVEPGNRIWVLDKEKIRQMLYHLMFSIIQTSSAGSILRLHVSNKNNGLRLTLWVSHPHLGEGLPYGVDFYAGDEARSTFVPRGGTAVQEAPVAVLAPPTIQDSEGSFSRNLGLLLSRQLVDLHGGQVSLQGNGGPGYRYVIQLPKLTLQPDMPR